MVISVYLHKSFASLSGGIKALDVGVGVIKLSPSLLVYGALTGESIVGKILHGCTVKQGMNFRATRTRLTSHYRQGRGMVADPRAMAAKDLSDVREMR
jgi:hypothetical protein